MLYIRIKENTQQAKLFAQYLKTLSFVEVIDIEENSQVSKEQFISDLKKSFNDVKLKKTRPLKKMFSGK